MAPSDDGEAQQPDTAQRLQALQAETAALPDPSAAVASDAQFCVCILSFSVSVSSECQVLRPGAGSSAGCESEFCRLGGSEVFWCRHCHNEAGAPPRTGGSLAAKQDDGRPPVGVRGPTRSTARRSPRPLRRSSDESYMKKWQQVICDACGHRQAPTQPGRHVLAGCGQLRAAEELRSLQPGPQQEYSASPPRRGVVVAGCLFAAYFCPE
ncbi:unnamed protein product, partial [Symbiodinium sp. CCMP2592]